MQETITLSTLDPEKLRLADIAGAVRSGYATFRAIPGVSIAYAAVFTAIGLILIGTVVALGFSPMSLPFAGAFMLVGPVVLSGYFELARKHATGSRPALADAFGAFRRAPAGLWLVALFCALLFLIWITDAGVFYSFTIGGQVANETLAWFPVARHDIWMFYFWISLVGSVLAYMIYLVSAFSVPLLYDKRATPIAAVHASVRTVLGNFLVCIAWGLVLSSIIIFSILLLPLLLISLPIMAYASYALYQTAFPESGSESVVI